MSECPGLSLESFLEWSYGVRDASVIPGFVDLFEDLRSTIEYLIGEFDEEQQSWRGYGSGLTDFVSKETDEKANALIKQWREAPEEKQCHVAQPLQSPIPWHIGQPVVNIHDPLTKSTSELRHE